MTQSDYDTILIGSGPANLFAAMELVNRTDQSVLVLERARRLNDSRNVGNGWLGGSARSLVHMFVEPGFGGDIEDQAVIDLFVQRLQDYSHSNIKTSRPRLLKRTLKRITSAGVTVEEPSTIVFSEDRMIKLGDWLYQWLKVHGTVLHKIDLHSIHKVNDTFEVQTNNGLFTGKRLVLGMGRGGAQTMRDLETNLELNGTQRGFQLGVRLEFPPIGMDECLSKTNYFRFKWDEFKTTLPSVVGSVETEEINHVKTSNGRTISGNKNMFTNIGILRKFDSENAHEDLYRLVEIVNVLCDGQLLREPVSRLLSDKSIVSPLPEFNEIKKGVAKLVELFPRLETRCSVYAPEARLNSIKFDLSPTFESEIDDLYIVGDMSGRTSSFVQSACSGLIAAADVIERGNE